MKLQKLEIRNLYGFMNKTILFDDQLNLLVGINGSGKTSVLNIISWLIQPSYADLCMTEFNQLNLTFLYEDKIHEILCTQTDKSMTIRVIVDGTPYHPLVTNLRIPAKIVANDPIAKDALISSQAYINLQPTQKEVPTWTYFIHLPNPIIISIDRKIEQKINKPNEQIIKFKNIISYNSSLDTVRKYSNEEYTKYNKKLIDLNKTLRNRILLSSFESSIINFTESVQNNINLSTEDADRLEVNFIKFLDEDEGNDKETNLALKNSIRKYAGDMRAIIENHKSSKKRKNNEDTSIEINYFINSNQFKRIQRLLTDFSTYENDSNKVYQSIQIYLESINHFLNDSSKEILFKKEDGQLYYNIKDKYGKDFKYEQNIDGLSSGEKQILILFTYLAFGSTKGRIVIIDEPEISLHPKWQDDFLQQLHKVTPKSTQLIVATHSPSIVGELENNCKVLLPYNE